MGLMDRIKKVTGTDDSYSYDDDYYNEFDENGETDSQNAQNTQGAIDPMSTGLQGAPFGAAASSGISFFSRIRRSARTAEDELRGCGMFHPPRGGKCSASKLSNANPSEITETSGRERIVRTSSSPSEW